MMMFDGNTCQVCVIFPLPPLVVEVDIVDIADGTTVLLSAVQLYQLPIINIM